MTDIDKLLPPITMYLRGQGAKVIMPSDPEWLPHQSEGLSYGSVSDVLAAYRRDVGALMAALKEASHG